MNYFVNASPLVTVFSLPPYDTKAFENVYDIIDSSPLYTKLFGARVQKKHTFAFNTIVLKEATAKFTERFFFARICAS